MRSRVLAVVSGALSLSIPAVAAPALHIGEVDLGSCSLSETTVYVTVPQAVTVTVHDTVTLSSLPTSTSTRVTTRYSSTTTYFALSTETISLSSVSSTSSYDETIYTTAMVTVTNFVTEGTLTASESSSNPYAFIVNDGSTYWFNSHTPPSTETFVVATSVVTVLPVDTYPASTPVSQSVSQPLQQPQTTTLTILTTLYSTSSTTVFASLSHPGNSTIAKATLSASGWAGWNASSSAAGVLTMSTGDLVSSTQVMKFNPSSFVSFVTEEPTFNIYAPETTTYHLSSYTAHGGFTGLPSSTTESSISTPAASFNSTLTSRSSAQVSQPFYNSILTSSPSAQTSPPSSTSSAIGEWTTATIKGQTVSWGGPGHDDSSTSASSTTFFSNSTGSGSATTSTAGRETATSSTQPASAFIGNFTSVLPRISASSVDTTCTDELVTSTRPFSSTLTSSTALGAFTSSLSLTSSLAVNSTTASAESSYTDFTTSIVSATSSSSPLSSSSTAIGVVTSLTATSSPTVVLGSSTDTSGNISTFWTSTAIASLPPTTYPSLTTVRSTELSTSTVSVLSSSSSSVSGVLSSTSAQPSTPSPTRSQSTTFITSTQSAVPSSCGQCGEFTLNFDDIPPLSVSNPDDQNIDPEPVFSPYHKFDFSNGFAVVPPPTDPYLPSSSPLLAEFIPNFNLTTSNPKSGPNSAQYGWSGDIGNADHGATGCFGFNFYGASFGCASTGPDCVFSFTGYKYSNTTGLETSITSSTVSISACPSQKGCQLSPINLEPTFRDLDVIRINVTVVGKPKMWWMDDLRMGWTDNSCSTGLCRQTMKVKAVKHL